MMTYKQELEAFNKWWANWGGGEPLLDDDDENEMYVAAEAAWMFRADYVIEYTAEDL
jgi:hypothetical protein